MVVGASPTKIRCGSRVRLSPSAPSGIASSAYQAPRLTPVPKTKSRLHAIRTRGLFVSSATHLVCTRCEEMAAFQRQHFVRDTLLSISDPGSAS
jgi:hypothetical protein